MNKSNKEIELFRNQKKNIIKFIRDKGIDKVSTYCATTMIPLIVVYTFILEDIEEYREIASRKLEELRKFYE